MPMPALMPPPEPPAPAYGAPAPSTAPLIPTNQVGNLPDSLDLTREYGVVIMRRKV